MEDGNWVPISKGFKKALPKGRKFTELEAMFSLQCDYDHSNELPRGKPRGIWSLKQL